MSAISPCDLKLHLAMPEIDVYIYKQNFCLKYKFEGSQNEKMKKKKRRLRMGVISKGEKSGVGM